MKTWLNGQPAESLEISDRGLSYGDGLFETVQIRDGRALLLTQHWARLQSGLVRLKFPADSLSLIQQDLAGLSLPESGVLKLTLTRGPGGRGYRLPDDAQVSRIVALGPVPAFPGEPAEKGVCVRLCETRLGLNPLLAGIKHLNRLEQVLARAEWQDATVAEGLVCDLKGYLAEGTMSNLFWVSEGELYTPQLDRCGVEGIVRNQLIALACRMGINVWEGRYRPEVLNQASEIFICNSLIDIWPVTQLGSQSLVVGDLTRKLQQLLQQEYQL